MGNLLGTLYNPMHDSTSATSQVYSPEVRKRSLYKFKYQTMFTANAVDM